jgi:hypothetical protein
LLGGVKAIPTIETYRLPRMRYREWTRGKELDALDRILHHLRRGWRNDDVDFPPEELDFVKHG